MSLINTCLKMCNRPVCLLHYLLILLALTRPCIGIGELKNPAVDFNEHSIVQPIVHHGRTKREISSTRDTNGAHHTEVHVTIPVEGSPWLLELRLNEDLVVRDHTLQYQERGKTVQHRLKKEELDLCHYSGSIRGKPQSWVAVSTCHGVRGVIFDGQRMRYIEPAQGAEIQSSHYLYDHKDLITETQNRSGHHVAQPGLVHSTDFTNITVYDREVWSRQNKKSGASRSKRETDNTQVRVPYNANKSSRYVELVLVADHREFRASGGDVRAVHSQMIQMANIINSMYAPLNIFIALVGVVVWSEGDYIEINEEGFETLTNFLKYREEKLVLEIPHDNAHLLTHQKFHDGIVGMSLPETMCKLKTSGGVAVNFTQVIGLEAATIAHEMGHNFGMGHDEDCPISICQDEKCIMSKASTSVVPVHWSSCSLQALETSFKKGLDYCLHNKPKRLLKSSTCGNGFVEPGEQCDCGITAGGGINPCHACCNPDTCMLRANATCGAGACCDLTTCRPRSAGVVCRATERECDLPEYCTGHSEFCPADVYKMDSIPCGVGQNQAYCMHGSCRSHTAQCRVLWGSTEHSRSHDECYVKNKQGNKEGNCGYDQTTQRYKPCASNDSLCGLLQCHSKDNWLEHAVGAGGGADAGVTSYVRNRVRFDCFIAKFDVEGKYFDLGMVPDGAKCGHEQMCLKQRCVSVEAVREELSRRDSSVCPSNCSGHGVCNSEGHCHCDAGFAPPRCAARGLGGSIVSGLATKPSGDPVNFRPTIKSSDRPINFRPTIKPSDRPINFRPTIEPRDRLINFRPTIKPRDRPINFRPTIKPRDRPVNFRPTIKPSNRPINFRPTIEPRDRPVNFRPTIKPRDHPVNFRPTIKPRDRPINFRPTIKPRCHPVNFRPTIKPRDRPINFRPTIKPSDRSVNSRPTIKPSDRSANFRPTFKPSDRSVNFRPTIKPSDRSVNFRPTIKPSGPLVNFRPTIKPSGPLVNFRPTIKPSDRSVNFRPDIKPRSGFISSRSAIKLSSGTVDSRPTIDPRPNEQRNFMTAIYVIFLGIIPSIVLLLFLIYYSRHNVLWKQPKELYAKYIAGCTKNDSKLANKMKTKKCYLDNVNKKTDKNVIEKSILVAELKPKNPLKNITKDDIQIVTNDVKLTTVEPVLNINKDDMQIAMNNKLKPVNRMLKVSKYGFQIPVNDVKLNPVEPLLNINKDDMHIVFTPFCMLCRTIEGDAILDGTHQAEPMTLA